MTGNYKIEKSTVECYKMRRPEGGRWADITIDDLGHQGRLQIASAYGSWSYFWNGCGKPFKEFLQDLNLDYVADKFRADEYFDLAETIKAMKQRVLESRRDNYRDKKTVRVVWGQIIQMDKKCGDQEEFKSALDASRETLKFFDWSPPIELTIHPRFRRFWEEIWGEFINHLKLELQSQKNNL